MRRVSQSSWVWKQGGVAGTDIADIFDPTYLKVSECWGRKRDMIDRQEIRSMQKVAVEQGTSEWHRFRSEGVGGSEVATLLNANPYKDGTVDNLYKLKVGELSGKAENENMLRGKTWEPVVRDLYSDLFGWAVEPVCVIDDEFPFMRASLDGLRSDDKLLVEIKCPRLHGQSKVAVEGVPPLYRAQVQYQLLVTQAEVAHFVSFCTEMDESVPERLIILEVKPSKRIHDILRTRVAEFWGFVQRREPPTLEWITAVQIRDWT